MKSILIIHPSNELYGADRIMVSALSALPADVKKTIYLPKEGPLTNYILENVENSEVEICQFMPIIQRSKFNMVGVFKLLAQMIRFTFFIRREKKKHRFDLAYSNTLSVSFGLIPLYLNSIKNFIHVHEIIDSPRIVSKITAQLARRFSKKVICVSHAVKKGLLRGDSKLDNKILVLHNGIAPIKTTINGESQNLTFYLFGRIMRKKGQWFLIDALKHISRKKLAKCHFVIKGGVLAGNENLLNELKTEIDSSGLSQYVSIEGFDSCIEPAMSKADVCLVPSLMKDPFPTTVLEAMSAGKPVIATNHGGAAEAILDGITGRLISPNNNWELANAIIELIDHHELIQQRGNAAQERYERYFSMERFHEEWNNQINILQAS